MGAHSSIPLHREEEILDVVRRCLAGDEAAWRLFYDHCGRVLPPVLRGFETRMDDAHEIIPDFVSHLFQGNCRALGSYAPRPPARFDNWLRVCFRHFALGWVRRNAPTRRNASVDVSAALERQGGAPCGDPAVLLACYETFEQLTDRERRLLSLMLSPLSYREIGERLGVKEGSVAVIVQRLRERLAVLLSSQVLDLSPPRTSLFWKEFKKGPSSDAVS